MGINLPIVPEFYKYILEDIKNYNANAIILEECFSGDRFGENHKSVVGITLIYDDKDETMYFGYFGIYDHNPNKIEYLLEKLIEYAKSKNYKAIIGPINIPTIIYGWGFMVEGSTKDLFIGCPINPPIYQKIFLEKKFTIQFEEERYFIPGFKLNPYELPEYDFSEYEYQNLNREMIWEKFDEILELHIKYQTPSAQITPLKSLNFKFFFDFVYSYGKDWMVWIVNHKSTNKIIAFGYVVPNIFHTDKKGRIDSLSLHYWVVHPDHRGKGLTSLMYGESSLRGMDRKAGNFIKWGYLPVGTENIPSKNSIKKLGGKLSKIHIILNYKL